MNTRIQHRFFLSHRDRAKLKGYGIRDPMYDYVPDSVIDTLEQEAADAADPLERDGLRRIADLLRFDRTMHGWAFSADKEIPSRPAWTTALNS